LNSNDEKKVRDRFGMNCFFSHGTNFAHGVCTIIPKGINFELIKMQKDDDGRYVMVSG
jgi:hypothetical protein